MRIFVYDGRQIPDPDPSLPIDEVRLSLANYFHELANATHTERQDGETTYVEFKRTVGTKGAPGYPPGSAPGPDTEAVQQLVGRFFADCASHGVSPQSSVRGWLWFSCPAHLRHMVEPAVKQDSRWVESHL